jgi:RsiW-degrading membrane proteinase PrsW (M82 family)
MAGGLASGEFTPTASLRQMSAEPEYRSVYPLIPNQTVSIGRDPICQMVVDSIRYTTVSRRHAEIRPVTTVDASMGSRWWLCDLNSSNGTFINGHKLVGCQVLQPGDRIVLGQQGPEYVFELLPGGSLPPGYFSENIGSRSAERAEIGESRVSEEALPSDFLQSETSGVAQTVDPRAMMHPDDRVTMTQLFPIFSTGLDITRKAYILPALVTITAVVSLFLVVGQPIWFNGILAAYLGLAAYYRVYQLCGKSKAWWILLATGLATVLLLRSPVFLLFVKVFRQILPGAMPKPGESINVLNMFFGAGLMEELLKALPLFAICLIGWGRSPKWRDRYGIREPLDGILFGTASAMGFTLLETLGQYVPEIIQNTTLQAGVNLADASQTQGLQLLIARLLGSIAGHMAYSGYFGYAIGLCVLKPDRIWLTLLSGYLTAAVLHTLWNSVGGLPIVGPFALAAIGLLSYALLAAAILKARTLSPNRDRNFATRLG